MVDVKAILKSFGFDLLKKLIEAGMALGHDIFRHLHGKHEAHRETMQLNPKTPVVPEN